METMQGFTIDPNDPPTFEKVRKMFQETREQMKETDRIVRELSKNGGGINNAFGRWAEEMVSAKLWEKFQALGYTFTIEGPREYIEGKRVVCQVDTLLENGEYAMAVEIKSELTGGDVDKHLEHRESKGTVGQARGPEESWWARWRGW
jgi:phenylalanyl-tRNA synthetase alpha subunit